MLGVSTAACFEEILDAAAVIIVRASVGTFIVNSIYRMVCVVSVGRCLGILFISISLLSLSWLTAWRLESENFIDRTPL